MIWTCNPKTITHGRALPDWAQVSMHTTYPNLINLKTITIHFVLNKCHLFYVFKSYKIRVTSFKQYQLVTKFYLYPLITWNLTLS